MLTPEEKADLMKELSKDAEGNDLFKGVLDNKNSFIAKPPRRRIAPN